MIPEHTALITRNTNPYKIQNRAFHPQHCNTRFRSLKWFIPLQIYSPDDFHNPLMYGEKVPRCFTPASFMYACIINPFYTDEIFQHPIQFFCFNNLFGFLYKDFNLRRFNLMFSPNGNLFQSLKTTSCDFSPWTVECDERLYILWVLAVSCLLSRSVLRLMRLQNEEAQCHSWQVNHWSDRCSLTMETNVAMQLRLVWPPQGFNKVRDTELFYICLVTVRVWNPRYSKQKYQHCDAEGGEAQLWCKQFNFCLFINKYPYIIKRFRFSSQAKPSVLTNRLVNQLLNY